MAKTKINYVCTQCGAIQPKWDGKMSGLRQLEYLGGKRGSSGFPLCFFGSAADSQIHRLAAKTRNRSTSSEEQRYSTQMEELNRVLGGGIVPGSVVLLSGDPGIGKSTLLLQICQTISSDAQILYVSGEESLRQIKLRAARLGDDHPEFKPQLDHQH